MLKLTGGGSNDIWSKILVDDIEIHEEKIRSVFDREEEIDLKVKEATERHLERFHKGKCQPAVGPIFLEILLNLERISDHCENIAEYSEDLKE